MEPVLNLSSEPFRNLRPLMRTATAMWVAGGLLLISNAWLFGSYFTGSIQMVLTKQNFFCFFFIEIPKRVVK